VTFAVDAVGSIVTEEFGTEMVYGVPLAVNAIVDWDKLILAEELPTPLTFITAVNQIVLPAARAVPLKFAVVEALQPFTVLDSGVMCCVE
jgi:hypothetical protein